MQVQKQRINGLHAGHKSFNHNPHMIGKGTCVRLIRNANAFTNGTAGNIRDFDCKIAYFIYIDHPPVPSDGFQVATIIQQASIFVRFITGEYSDRKISSDSCNVDYQSATGFDDLLASKV